MTAPEGAYWDAEQHEPLHADGSRITGGEIFACGEGGFRVRRFWMFCAALEFFSEKTASCFVVFGKVRTFASEKQNKMSDNYSITQACVWMAMPSGQHVCLFRIGSHSRCHF